MERPRPEPAAPIESAVDAVRCELEAAFRRARANGVGEMLFRLVLAYREEKSE